MEDVAGVVGGLDLGEPLVFGGAVAGSHPVGVVVRHQVHVAARPLRIRQQVLQSWRAHSRSAASRPGSGATAVAAMMTPGALVPPKAVASSGTWQKAAAHRHGQQRRHGGLLARLQRGNDADHLG